MGWSQDGRSEEGEGIGLVWGRLTPRAESREGQNVGGTVSIVGGFGKQIRGKALASEEGRALSLGREAGEGSCVYIEQVSGPCPL